jgi:hypothetical protein
MIFKSIEFLSNITFTMEKEVDGSLLFVDIRIYKRPDGTLGNAVLAL